MRSPHALILLLCALAVAAPLTRAESLVRAANTTLALPAAAPAEFYMKEVAFTSLSSYNQASSMVSPPGETARLFIAQKEGKITVLTNLPGTDKETFLDLEGTVEKQGESGLLGLAFNPNYATNGYFYIFYSFSEDGDLF